MTLTRRGRRGNRGMAVESSPIEKNAVPQQKESDLVFRNVQKGEDEKEEKEKFVIEEKTLLHTDDDISNDETLKEIINQIKSGNISDISSIDLSTDYSIKIMIGNAFDIEYKLAYAYHIITNELRQNKSGYLIYHDSLGYSYVSKEEYDEINKKSEILMNGNQENIVTEKLPSVTTAVTSAVSVESNVTVTNLPAVTTVKSSQ